MEKTGPTVGQQCAQKMHSRMQWKLFTVDFCVFVYFQQREPFKKRWFTLCSVNRKLIYYKTPLVNHNRYIGNGCIEYIVLNQMQG